MYKTRLRNVQIERQRDGRPIYYYRKGRGLRIRLPDQYGTTEFHAAYALAATQGISIPREKKISEFNHKKTQAVETTLINAVKRAKQRARERKLEFDLDYEWVLAQARKQKFKCCLTGIPFFMPTAADSHVNPYQPSLDRIDSKGGYARTNVRLVVYAVNAMLMDWGTIIFERVMNGYRVNKPKSQNPNVRASIQPGSPNNLET